MERCYNDFGKMLFYKYKGLYFTKEYSMSEQIQTEGLSLTNILKLFLSKIKLLIIVLICGGIVGGAFGFIRTNGVNYYGTSLEFYINPESPEDSVNSESTYGVYGAYGKHVMDNMIKLLSSEIFAEKLILNGADVPEKDTWGATNEENATLNALIDTAKPDVAAYKAAQAALQTANSEKTAAELAFNKAYTELKNEWTSLFGDSFTQSKYDDLDTTNPDYSDLKTLYEECDRLDGEVKAAEKSVASCKEDLATKKAAYESTVKPVLAAWRKTDAYKASLQQYREAVSFSYVGNDESVEDAADLARSFIYVNINVLGDANKAFAEDLMTRIQVQVPAYVSENMIVPTGYSGTRCIEITTTSGIVHTNPSYTSSSVIKFGLLGGAAALVIACVILVIIDSSDKRVRSYDQISNSLKVPLLGIIPSIDEEQIDAWHASMKNGNKGAHL